MGAPIMASTILQQVSNDLHFEIGPDHPNLITYLDRVHLWTLKFSRWKFLESPPQYFVTYQEQTDYWIGQKGSGPPRAHDTGLNILNLGTIIERSVYDRTNSRLLARTSELPAYQIIEYPTGLPRYGRPRLWRNAPETPYILNLYPSPDNAGDIVPVVGSPAPSTVAGGSLSGRFYTAAATWTDSNGGESLCSAPLTFFIPAGYLAVLGPPAAPLSPDNGQGVCYNGWNVYAGISPNGSQASTSGLVLQSSSPMTFSQVYTEPSGGISPTGKSIPGSSTLEELQGYIIQFRYWQARNLITSSTVQLQVPADYRDVIAHGVDAMAAKYLLQDDGMSQFYAGLYAQGLTGMIHDKNLFPRGDFIGPDVRSVRMQSLGIETFDYDFFTPYLLG